MATFTPDTSNEMFQLAVQLINQSNRNIFLTGKAGTGKTTFLKYIRENCPKQMAIVASTGVAAINAGGVTIHSFFQLPLSPFIPETRGTGFPAQEVSNKHSLISRLRFNRDRKKVLQQLELLVIDEVSMVRCDTLDAIDTVLRHIRQRPYERFGGVQMLFIGDMLQLPPVIKEQVWSVLSEYYSGQYFFDSKVLQEEPPVFIEFNKIYRQKDEQFIRLLNQVRNNDLDEESLKILNDRIQPGFSHHKEEGYIILTTHNQKASDINAGELAKLGGRLFTYKAEVTDEFSDRAYPADEVLRLKEGAQVMFIRNDAAEKGKRYFNGKIGIVSKLEEDKIFVQCDGESAGIEVQKEKWENIRYTLNKTTRQLDSDVLGSFTQYPLRLAWAITIHKSQGLTFEKAVIDAGDAFAPGQVYVALSRCTNLEGMVLKSRVKPSGLFSDIRIVEFSRRSASSDNLQQELIISRENYRQAVLLSLFDFDPAISSARELLEYLLEHRSSFSPESILWVQELSKKLGVLQDTASKFRVQLQSLFQRPGVPEDNQLLQERLNAAAGYFVSEAGQIVEVILQSPVITDSRLHSKEYNGMMKEIFAQLSERRFLLEGCKNQFIIEDYQERKRKFLLPAFTVNSYALASSKRSESPHPVLHQQLRKLRDQICSRKDLPIYIVAGSNTLDEMARYLPQTLAELRKVSGFGDAKIDQYGQQFLDIIVEYSSQRNLSSLIHEKSPKRERKERSKNSIAKGDTYAETFKLYKEGLSIDTIAKNRVLTIGTIETHLARFVRSGEIKIEELVSPDKRALIESAIRGVEGNTLTPIKEQLGDTVSYGEIRWVMAGLGISYSKQPD